jgi:hypothetical protein
VSVPAGEHLLPESTEAGLELGISYSCGNSIRFGISVQPTWSNDRIVALASDPHRRHRRSDEPSAAGSTSASSQTWPGDDSPSISRPDLRADGRAIAPEKSWKNGCTPGRHAEQMGTAACTGAETSVDRMEAGGRNGIVWVDGRRAG